jgi:hypothetical protein
LRLRALFSGYARTLIRVAPKASVTLGVTTCVHGIVAVLVLNTTPPRSHRATGAIDVALVLEPTAIEEEPPAFLDMEDMPRPAPPDYVAEEIAADESVAENSASAATTPSVSVESTNETPTEHVDPAENAYSFSPGTQSVLRGLQCPGDPEAFARTGICPQGAGRHTQMVAANETASNYYMIDVESIRARFGQAPHLLSGQATLDNGTQRHSLSNADTMRDALPASQPDPAFGD